MDKEKEGEIVSEIAAAHQEINLLRCRLDATGALIVVYAVMSGLNFGNWISLGIAVVASVIYGYILWRFADKPFEKYMNS
ncbi:MAG: hypothetical protein SV201_02400 [Pseudomonadota bacterium]|nr:hypothetical protein [Pseudomonadota bacterium]